jgi:hypothetical protein
MRKSLNMRVEDNCMKTILQALIIMGFVGISFGFKASKGAAINTGKKKMAGIETSTATAKSASVTSAQGVSVTAGGALGGGASASGIEGGGSSGGSGSGGGGADPDTALCLATAKTLPNYKLDCQSNPRTIKMGSCWLMKSTADDKYNKLVEQGKLPKGMKVC